MNLRGGIALIKSTWFSWMQHRGFFFLLAFGWMIPPLIYLFVWMMCRITIVCLSFSYYIVPYRSISFFWFFHIK